MPEQMKKCKICGKETTMPFHTCNRTKMKTSFIVPEIKCPTCGHTLNAATIASPKCNRAPKAGDVSVCIKCGEPLTFQADLKVRISDLNDLMSLTPAERDILDRAQHIIRNMKAKPN